MLPPGVCLAGGHTSIVEQFEALDAALKDAAAALLVHIIGSVAGQGCNHPDALFSQEGHQVLLPGLQQHRQVAAVYHLQAHGPRPAGQVPAA